MKFETKVYMGFVLCLLGIGCLIYYAYVDYDYDIYFKESHFFSAYWDCDNNNMSETLTSSCEDVLIEMLENGCILMEIQR